jgi:LDH2 family malate/lactate/ureidoglycolate dehydrogenase
MNVERFDADHLVEFAQSLLRASGMREDLARDVAEVLVEGDLLGHDTHGLQLLGPYLSELERGTMLKEGEPNVLSEFTVSACWDGLRLPGPYLVRRAVEWALPRARMHGQASVAIRRSHHIACLAAYLETVTRSGMMMVLSCSDPASASVAPFGGTQAVFTPNPLAIGIPTSGDPIMIDISASITTNGMSNRMKAAGQTGEHSWWLDAMGQPSVDPAVLSTQPPGSILPLGGLDSGHKGYGLALMIEALTAGLSGHGRADVSEGWGATVFVQLFDPAAFAGLGAFTWQTDWLAEACRSNLPRDTTKPVRLPGQRGLALKAEQLAKGVALHSSISPQLKSWAGKLKIAPLSPKFI